MFPFRFVRFQTLQVTTPSPLGRDKGGASSPSPSPLPVYRVRGVGLVSSEGLCESVLFGLPLVARPTACWKLDWEDLLTNQQHFTTLAKLLRERVRNHTHHGEMGRILGERGVGVGGGYGSHTPTLV